MMDRIDFAIVGGGWRTEFYLRIARELPERFRVTGVMTRRAEQGEALTAAFGVNTVRTLDELLMDRPAFVVTSVSWGANPVFVRELSQRGVPVLSETPPAPDLDALNALSDLVERGARVQIAEQYPLQPEHAARIYVARSGRIGSQVSQAQVSAAHGYHGTVLIRRLLGVGLEDATITAMNVVAPILQSPGRDSLPDQERLVDSHQTIAWLEFESGRLGVFDFTGDQYFSWIRGPRVLARGERGEIAHNTVRWLIDAQTGIDADFRRRDTGHAGNLEGHSLSGITLGDWWIWRNPFFPARLTDDEIAIAQCLEKMAEFVDGGAPFYTLAEGLQDHYLGLTIAEAARTRQPIRTVPQRWRAAV